MSAIRYEGFGPEEGKSIEEEFAFGYAMERIMAEPEETKAFKDMVVEWFYSGNWIKKER